MNDEARRLKSRGIDIIIVLSHCGLDVDRIMAAKCPLIDLIVGGHSHTFLYSGNYNICKYSNVFCLSRLR